MGANVSIEDCVDLKDLPVDIYESIVSESYTVQRTPKSGELYAKEETGWKIPREPINSWSGWECSHATNKFLGSDNKRRWKYYMESGLPKDHVDYVFGWRACENGKRTFWPTRLKTQEEREAWWTWLDSHVTTLKTHREQTEAQLKRNVY